MQAASWACRTSEIRNDPVWAAEWAGSTPIAVTGAVHCVGLSGPSPAADGGAAIAVGQMSVSGLPGDHPGGRSVALVAAAGRVPQGPPSSGSLNMSDASSPSRMQSLTSGRTPPGSPSRRGEPAPIAACPAARATLRSCPGQVPARKCPSMPRRNDQKETVVSSQRPCHRPAVAAWCPRQRHEVAPVERPAAQSAIQLRIGPAQAEQGSSVPSAVRYGMHRARETKEA